MSGPGVWRQLRQAAASCNQWRDTLFCTALLAVGVAAAEWGVPIRPSCVLWAPVFRELGRGLAWHTANQRLALTALASAALLVCMRDLASAIETGDPAGDGYTNAASIGMALSVVPMTLRFSGGMKGAYAAYRKTLFDWPRKILPPRKPRERRLLDRVIDALLGLAPAPQGARSTLR